MRVRRAAGIAAAVGAVGCCGALVASGESVRDRGGAPARPREPVAERQPTGLPRGFDLQAHRGGLGLVTESTLEAFASALEVGVTTLELDVRLSADDRPVVTHDRRVSAVKCRDTSPVVAGDRDFPYVGDPIRALTFAQIKTLDCGRQQLPGFPHQRVVANARMPLLGEVFALVRCYGADDVRFSIDPKYPAEAPGQSASRRRLARVVAGEIRAAAMRDRVAITSSDWGVLMRMSHLDPRLPLIAAAHPRLLEAGSSGASPWLGGIDIDDFDGRLVAAAASFGADAISPVHGTPADATVGDAGYDAFTTRKVVRRAHRAGLKVIPWTVDDPASMQRLIKIGVDGIVSDYPDRVRSVMAADGLRLPAPTPPPPAGRACLP
jgi:glycerophosphoryl diester phosphodiesterase